ncbi:MAG: hypothetical protein MZU84_02795 [Sphingobacterium sp.]|nr:hypothetical protein [Sphingobacterium sp.]
MAAGMIPVMFLLGKTIANTKVGIIAAGTDFAVYQSSIFPTHRMDGLTIT